MTPATTAKTADDARTTAFHCSSDWHLTRLGRYAAEIHALMLRVQDENFFGSVEQIAEYFGADDRTVRGRLHALRDLGFVEKIESRAGDSVVYCALTHTEWAAKHPGCCCVKRENPSHEMGGVGVQNTERGGQKVTPQNGPLPSNGSTPLPSHGRAPLPSHGRQVSEKSPNKSPKDTDTALQQKDAASTAAIEAFNSFRREMEEQSAFDMVLWILYRAASIKDGAQIPQSVAYYTQAKENFISQHENDWDSVTETAEGKFCKHAYRLVEANSPDLLAWLKEKARQLAERSAAAA